MILLKNYIYYIIVNVALRCQVLFFLTIFFFLILYKISFDLKMFVLLAVTKIAWKGTLNYTILQFLFLMENYYLLF